jgi:hypothetical protein
MVGSKLGTYKNILDRFKYAKNAGAFMRQLLVIALAILLLSGCRIYDTLGPSTVSETVISTTPGTTGSTTELPSATIEKDLLPEEKLLFSDDFSTASAWQGVPVIADGAAVAKDISMSTIEEFPSKNGLEVSFELMPRSSTAPFAGFSIKIAEKAYASNIATLEVRADGTVNYGIQGHCVPTPQVLTGSIAVDGKFHEFTFIAHADGKAEWLLDGSTAMERNKFDTGGLYTLQVSGSSAIGAKDTSSSMLLDNITISSLGEPEAASKICEPEVVEVKNTCPYAGYCNSNGICCPADAQYYCEGTCYTYRNKAMAVSAGRCNSWRVIC